MDHNMKLRRGLYEHLINNEIASQLQSLPAELKQEVNSLPLADIPERVSRYVAEIIRRELEGLPNARKEKRSEEIANHILKHLHVTETEYINSPLRILAALLNKKPSGKFEDIQRPETPLLDSASFTNSSGVSTKQYER